MFIKVKARLYLHKGERNFSEYAVNINEIIAVWDKYTFNGRVTYVRISMSNGVEFECEDSFEYFEKNLGDKFAKFNINESVWVLANKKNVLYINRIDWTEDFKTEITLKDLMGKSLFVRESVGKVIERLI